MGYVSKEQIARARQVRVLDYVLSREAGDYMRTGSSYRMKEHPSLVVNANGWYWHSHGIGGKTALDYLINVRGCGLGEAVIQTRPPAEMPKTERTPFAIPVRNDNHDRVIAYLQSRGIDIALIEDCIKRGVIYESRRLHNAVFIGRDERGKARFASMRGTLSAYKGDADGSDKSYGFVLPPDNPNSKAVAIFESPIDALSHQTLCRQDFIPAFDGWRLSLGGTSLLAIERFRKTHTGISHCVICTDNDDAGSKAASRIVEISGLSCARAPPPQGKDWNDTLQAALKARRTKNRARPSPCR